MGGGSSGRLCLAELLADLSLVTDLGMGHEPETAARTCLLACGLTRALDLPEAVVVDTYYTALLLHLGCTAYAHEAAAAFGGDDIAVFQSGARTDFSAPTQVFTTWLPGVVRGLPLGAKLRVGATALVRSAQVGAALQRATCEVAVGTARRLSADSRDSESHPNFASGRDGVGQSNSNRSRRPPHQGTAISGMSAWRSTGEYVRRLRRTTMVSARLMMTPPVERKRRWRVSGVAAW